MVSVEPPEEIHLFLGGDLQGGLQPEVRQTAREVPVSVAKNLQIPFLPDRAHPLRHLLKIPNRRVLDRLCQGLVPVPFRKGVFGAVPPEDGIGVLQHAGLQTDQGVRNLEGGIGRNPLFAFLFVINRIRALFEIVEHEGSVIPVEIGAQVLINHFLPTRNGLLLRIGCGKAPPAHHQQTDRRQQSYLLGGGFENSQYVHSPLFSGSIE